jgi:hypothetical protein
MVGHISHTHTGLISNVLQTGIGYPASVEAPGSRFKDFLLGGCRHTTKVVEEFEVGGNESLKLPQACEGEA